MKQINQYMIEEGLSYVLDNEAARAIQQHMWDEQLKNELMEAEYGVEIRGAALDLLEGIRKTVDNIINLLNPFRAINNVFSAATATAEMAGMEADIAQVLELGKVGTGNAQSFYQLTTRGRNLNVTDNLVALFGGTSLFEIANAAAHIVSTMPGSGSPTGSILQRNNAYTNAIVGAVDKVINSSRDFGVDSRYSWGTISKSTNAILQAIPSPTGSEISSVSHAVSTTAKAQSNVAAKLKTMLSEDYMMGMVEAGKSYSDWVESGKQFGITDMSKALEDAGYSEEGVRASFQSAQVQQGRVQELARMDREMTYWDNTESYQLTLKDNSQILIELMNTNNERLEDIYQKHSDFYNAWVDYYVNHTAYNEAFGKVANSVNTIRSKEKDQSDSAVYALAEALNSNSVDLLKDPVLQTNAILAQILIVVNAIMQQNNSTGGVVSLPDTLQALAMGLTGGTGVVKSL